MPSRTTAASADAALARVAFPTRCAKGDYGYSRREICDCIAVCNAAPPEVVPVEPKGGLARPEPVFERLSDAAGIVARVERHLFGKGQYRVGTLLVAKRRMSSTFYAMARACISK